MKPPYADKIEARPIATAIGRVQGTDTRGRIVCTTFVKLGTIYRDKFGLVHNGHYLPPSHRHLLLDHYTKP